MARISPGVKSKPKLMHDVCADCGSTDPNWASVNRGILICDGCSTVHRSLGRHISVIKSLSKGKWHSSELAMFNYLRNSGANSIWEHTLLDPSATKVLQKKPQPSDPLHPTKANFIKAKHQLLSFVYRPGKDENSDADIDISKQLHASVRTPKLEISLRLLSLGANPNYLNEEKGNCPLHVASVAGQSTQVELLVLYGADPGAPDKEGKLPIDYARDSGHLDIADRLVELQYETIDRLSYYLCGKSPKYESITGNPQISGGLHWVIPEQNKKSVAEPILAARDKLFNLPNHSLTELMCDIYDEVDRRELDSICLSLQSQSKFASDQCSVPFLPVNPELSSTRNQGRQKLARFNSEEFSVLIHDVLSEIKRRTTEYSLSSFNSSERGDQCEKTSHNSLTDFPPSLTSTTVNCFSDRRNVLRQTCPAGSRKPTSLALSLNRKPNSTDSPSSLTCYNSSSNSTTTIPSNQITTSKPFSDSTIKYSTVCVSSTTNTVSAVTCSNITNVTSSYTSSTTNHQPTGVTSSTICTSSSTPLTRDEDTDEDEPLYDSVASEDDYSSWERRKKLHQQKEFIEAQRKGLIKGVASEDEIKEQLILDCHDDTADASSTQLTELGKKSASAPIISVEQYLGMKKHLERSEVQIRELQESNVVMTAKLNELTNMVLALHEENESLRQHSAKSASLPKRLTNDPHQNLQHISTGVNHTSPSYFSSTPTHKSHSKKYVMPDSVLCRSLSPTYDSPVRYNNGDVSYESVRMRDSLVGTPSSVSSTKSQRPYSMFESSSRERLCQTPDNYNSAKYQHHYDIPSPQSHEIGPSCEYFPVSSSKLPSQDEVIRKTEIITRKIQELLQSARESKYEKFVLCSEQIMFAVKEMSKLFPKNGCPPMVSQAVHQLSTSACRLQGECRSQINSQLHVLDPATVTQQVIQCAYDIAKATKNLVTHFQ